MIKHLVFWKLKDHAEGASAEENARKVCELLLGLKPRIPELLEIDCGVDFSRGPASYDVALHTKFRDRAALEVYQEHPEHIKARDFIQKVVSGRAVVDYEL